MTVAYIFILENESNVYEDIDRKLAKGDYLSVPLPNDFEWDTVSFQVPTGLLFFK